MDLTVNMDAVNRKVADLDYLHDWTFPVDKMEKQVRLQAQIVDLENAIEPMSHGRIADIHVYSGLLMFKCFCFR